MEPAIRSYDLEGAVCARCGFNLDAVVGPVAPYVGDWCVCVECTTVHIIDATDPCTLREAGQSDFRSVFEENPTLFWTAMHNLARIWAWKQKKSEEEGEQG